MSSLRRGAGVAAVLLLVAACSTPAGVDRVPDQPAPSGPASPATSAAPSAAPSAAAAAQGDQPSAKAAATVIEPADGVLPRVVAYGALTWTMTGAAITNQDPAQFVAGTPGEPTPKTSLVVDFEIRNDSPHVFFVNTTSRLVAQLPDGSLVPGRDLERPSAPPESTVESRYAFEVPAATTFDGLLLRFADADREPSVDVPLAGTAPAVEQDETTKVDRAVAIGIPGIEMRWTVDSLITGHDWPLPIGFKGGTLVPGTRAQRDHQWVGVVARVDVNRCDCRGGVLDQSGSARLLVDGTPFTASAADSSKAIMNASTFSDVMLVFDIPASARSVTLQVGPLEEPEQQATIPLTLD